MAVGKCVAAFGRERAVRAFMAAKQKKHEPVQTWAHGPLLAARFLLLIATAGAGYLAWVSLSGGTVAGCGPSSGCNEVLQTRWAYWLGVPVSLPAMLVYLGLLVATFFAQDDRRPERRRKAWLWILGLSILVAGAAAWFVGVQSLVIQRFCPFCLTAHASAFAAAGLLWWFAPLRGRARADARMASRVGISPRSQFRWQMLGWLGVVLLVSGQLLVKKQLFHVAVLAGTNDISPAATTNALAAPRVVRLHDGKFQLNLDEVPVIGSREAPHVMVSLFDYTCHYCREMHHLLLAAHQQFGDQLAIINLPMPLDSDCNHMVKRTPPAHVHACEYAKLGLAVWKAKPEASEEFDSHVFGPARPPALDELRQFAEQLVGREALARALADPWVAQQLETDIGIYAANSAQTRNGGMPQLIIGSTVSVGPLNSVQDLDRLLAQYDGLKLVQP